LLGKARGSLRFELADDGMETWRVTLDKGDVVVSREHAAADCVVRAEKPLFEAILTGEANAMTALLRGALTYDGDPELLVRFQRLLSAHASRPAERGAGPAGGDRR
jgi:putative sterol carrier protein